MSKGKGCDSNFSKCGGTADPTNGQGTAMGHIVKAGEKKNLKPPNAKNHASFGSVGGKSKGY